MGTTNLTREEAIRVTDNFITNLSPEQAYNLFKEHECDVYKLHQYAFSLGISGWYYSVENNLFCNELIVQSILLLAINHVTKQ